MTGQITEGEATDTESWTLGNGETGWLDVPVQAAVTHLELRTVHAGKARDGSIENQVTGPGHLRPTAQRDSSSSQEHGTPRNDIEK